MSDLRMFDEAILKQADFVRQKWRDLQSALLGMIIYGLRCSRLSSARSGGLDAIRLERP